MARRAIGRGVPEAKIAEALGLEVASIHRRSQMLYGICTEVIDILKDLACPTAVFDVLRCMSPIRQIEAAELMTGQQNFTVVCAKAMLAATPDDQLVRVPANRPASVSSEQMARMERELIGLQMQVKSVEDRYGIDGGTDPPRPRSCSVRRRNPGSVRQASPAARMVLGTASRSRRNRCTHRRWHAGGNDLRCPIGCASADRIVACRNHCHVEHGYGRKGGVNDGAYRPSAARCRGGGLRPAYAVYPW